MLFDISVGAGERLDSKSRSDLSFNFGDWSTGPRRLARRTEAEVAGLAGIDLSYIEAPMPGAIGATA